MFFLSLCFYQAYPEDDATDGVLYDDQDYSGLWWAFLPLSLGLLLGILWLVVTKLYLKWVREAAANTANYYGTTGKREADSSGEEKLLPLKGETFSSDWTHHCSGVVINNSFIVPARSR